MKSKWVPISLIGLWIAGMTVFGVAAQGDDASGSEVHLLGTSQGRGETLPCG